MWSATKRSIKSLHNWQAALTIEKWVWVLQIHCCACNLVLLPFFSSKFCTLRLYSRPSFILGSDQMEWALLQIHKAIHSYNMFYIFIQTWICSLFYRYCSWHRMAKKTGPWSIWERRYTKKSEPAGVYPWSVHYSIELKKSDIYYISFCPRTISSFQLSCTLFSLISNLRVIYTYKLTQIKYQEVGEQHGHCKKKNIELLSLSQSRIKNVPQIIGSFHVLHVTKVCYQVESYKLHKRCVTIEKMKVHHKIFTIY